MPQTGTALMRRKDTLLMFEIKVESYLQNKICE